MAELAKKMPGGQLPPGMPNGTGLPPTMPKLPNFPGLPGNIPGLGNAGKFTGLPGLPGAGKKK
jgi:hypothetical protein